MAVFKNELLRVQGLNLTFAPSFFVFGESFIFDQTNVIMGKRFRFTASLESRARRAVAEIRSRRCNYRGR